MINENPTFNDSFYTGMSFRDLLSTLRNILKQSIQPEAHFQEIEETTYGSNTDFFLEALQKVMDLLRMKWEMIKDFIVNIANVVKTWLHSDNVLNRLVNSISKEIYISSNRFGTKIESIELKEAYEDHPYEEIEIDIKVPKEMDINELNLFWDYVGTNIDTLINNEDFPNSEKEIEIRERLLIVVSQ